MAEADKKQLLTLINRSADVIDGEVDLLARWARTTTSIGRAARCESTKLSIESGPRTKMRALLALTEAVPPDRVTKRPGPAHEALVEPNEQSLDSRRQRKADDFPNNLFTIALSLAESNSEDSVHDAEAILSDCTPPQLTMAPALAATRKRGKRRGRKRGGNN